MDKQMLVYPYNKIFSDKKEHGINMNMNEDQKYSAIAAIQKTADNVSFHSWRILENAN